ncbi:diaminobutyrate--2-oxoglutarate transaminase [Ketobacter sp. MCCC 1A13808]|uniref:diaminobutyrate--2-oxoglutarate transaminase n=1 Tax=Ketobacter sp. MCCC 1A13808 TaxID=2602738 RepID=UPI0012EC5966|nr:diaminobutyrate--2-oxoglutarate transaminase [Ketobacter sp. MCCC 1A13808]MVF14803.1 diaminobutyrate--2-oxoglutarate transaminase [Ketobacter sp. MCCC 1A13808]
MGTEIFHQYESEVRSYCRAFPTIFKRAKGSFIEDEDGRRYLDFFAGAGALNYGHNPDFIREKLIDYLRDDGIMQALDMFTVAKGEFIKTLQEKILLPRKLDYRIQCCGPTGTNAVEAALKIARKVKGRAAIFAFQGGFHGMSLGSLACTGNQYNRMSAGTPLPNVNFMPYPFGAMEKIDTIAYMDSVLSDPNSGFDKPAAVLVETVQAEGGIVVAPEEWLKQLRALCDKHDLLLIVDDIQVGCGRTGGFFSFERAGIVPDVITLSKSISGYGLPMAIVLLKPELDKWLPGEHSGTFRGHQLAFIGGAAGIEMWTSQGLQQQVEQKSLLVENSLSNIIEELDPRLQLRGLGLIWGLDFSVIGNSDLVERVLAKCFDKGLLIENAGRKGQVMKLLPPLTISENELQQGLDIIRDSMKECFLRTAGQSYKHVVTR